GSAAYEQAGNYGLDRRARRADLDYPVRDQDLGHAEQEDQGEYDGTAPEPDMAGKSIPGTDRRVQAGWPPRPAGLTHRAHPPSPPHQWPRASAGPGCARLSRPRCARRPPLDRTGLAAARNGPRPAPARGPGPRP